MRERERQRERERDRKREEGGRWRGSTTGGTVATGRFGERDGSIIKLQIWRRRFGGAAGVGRRSGREREREGGREGERKMTGEKGEKDREREIERELLAPDSEEQRFHIWNRGRRLTRKRAKPERETERKRERGRERGREKGEKGEKGEGKPPQVLPRDERSNGHLYFSIFIAVLIATAGILILVRLYCSAFILSFVLHLYCSQDGHIILQRVPGRIYIAARARTGRIYIAARARIYIAAHARTDQRSPRASRLLSVQMGPICLLPRAPQAICTE